MQFYENFPNKSCMEGSRSTNKSIEIELLKNYTKVNSL